MIFKRSSAFSQNLERYQKGGVQYWTATAGGPLLSPLDLMVVFAAALLFFGPDQLPQVARKVGRITRDIQNTSQAFLREMERAADLTELTRATPPVPSPAPSWTEHASTPEWEKPGADATAEAWPANEPEMLEYTTPEAAEEPHADVQVPPTWYEPPDARERWRGQLPAARPLL
jgi:Sec-independent protein translocase protein TatA